MFGFGMPQGCRIKMQEGKRVFLPLDRLEIEMEMEDGGAHSEIPKNMLPNEREERAMNNLLESARRLGG